MQIPWIVVSLYVCPQACMYGPKVRKYVSMLVCMVRKLVRMSASSYECLQLRIYMRKWVFKYVN